MGVRSSGKALRAMVAQLTERSDDEIEDILSDFDHADRAKLEALIHRYQSGDQPETAADKASDAVPRDGLTTFKTPLVLSPWLLTALNPAEASGGDRRTPHAMQTLRRIARDHGWTPPHQTEKTSAAGRVFGWFGRRR